MHIMVADAALVQTRVQRTSHAQLGFFVQTGYVPQVGQKKLGKWRDLGFDAATIVVVHKPRTIHLYYAYGSWLE